MFNSEPLIELKNLSIGYRAGRNYRTVIPHIQLDAPRGSLIGLVGANGSGKSTLLKTMAGLQPATKGRVCLEKKNVETISKSELARKMSFVGTHHDMHAMMRVHQVVSYGRYPYTNIIGRLHEKDKDQVRKAMHDTGIFHLRDAFVGEISDGEKQRVLIARSLAQDTDIILLDEPTAFLDVKNKFEVLHLLGRLAHEKQKMILFSSHDLQIVLGAVDLLWFIDQKKIIQGLPEELVLKGTINELFRHSEVFFDADKNEFRIKRNHHFCIKLIGEGAAYTWTQHALERLHIKVDTMCNSPEVSIVQDEGEINWHVTNTNQNKVFESLKDTIAYLFAIRKM